MIDDCIRNRNLNRYRLCISISLVSVWEVNFVLFNSILKYVINKINACLFPYRDCYHPSSDIDPRTKALWPISVSRDDNSLDMEKGMH
jgi:hypothetical protein